jgi:hypothetical protein
MADIAKIVASKKKVKKTKTREFDDIKFNSLHPEEQAAFLWNKYKLIRAEKLPNFTNKDADDIMLEFRQDYKYFCELFPIVIRYMCQFQSFSSKAFRRYLLKMKHNPPKSKFENVVDRNADYVRYLWEETNKNPTRAESNKVWTEVHKILEDEYHTYEAVEEEAKNRIKLQETKALEEKRAELIALRNKLVGTA